MEFGIEIEGDRLVALRFDQFPERARAAIGRRLSSLTERLLSRVVGVEPQRTGKLRGETGSRVFERDDRVVGQVRVAAPDSGEHGKAAALEYGASHTALVRAHTMQLSHVYDKLVEPIEVMVAAYSRHPNIAERRYLRGPLDAMRGEIIAELRAALDEAWGA